MKLYQKKFGERFSDTKRIQLDSVVAVHCWNTELADMRFSIYCPRTWFSLRNLTFSSLTLSTRWDSSVWGGKKHWANVPESHSIITFQRILKLQYLTDQTLLLLNLIRTQCINVQCCNETPSLNQGKTSNKIRKQTYNLAAPVIHCLHCCSSSSPWWPTMNGHAAAAADSNLTTMLAQNQTVEVPIYCYCPGSVWVYQYRSPPRCYHHRPMGCHYCFPCYYLMMRTLWKWILFGSKSALKQEESTFVYAKKTWFAVTLFTKIKIKNKSISTQLTFFLWGSSMSLC